MESLNYSSKTIRLYSTSVRIAWGYGETREWPEDPRKLETRDVRPYMDYLRRYSSGTQYAYMIGLLLFLRWCGNSNMKDFKLRLHPVRTNVDWMTVEEVSAAITSAPNLWTRTIEIMFAYTGIRISELAYLRTADVHPDKISVVGKGSKARTIPVTDAFWQAMRPYQEWRRNISSPLYLCHGATQRYPAGPYTISGIESALKVHSEQLGRHMSAHTFRRSYGRHLYLAGMPLAEIQRLYGHKSMATTIGYLGIMDSDLLSSVNKYQPKY